MKQLLYFSTKWCSNCQSMESSINQLKKQSNQIQIHKFDTDYDVSQVQQFNIKNIPAIVLLENGNEIKRYIGALNSQQLNNWINA